MYDKKEQVMLEGGVEGREEVEVGRGGGAGAS